MIKSVAGAVSKTHYRDTVLLKKYWFKTVSHFLIGNTCKHLSPPIDNIEVGSAKKGYEWKVGGMGWVYGGEQKGDGCIDILPLSFISLPQIDKQDNSLELFTW